MSMPDPSRESEVLPRVPATPTAPLPDEVPCGRCGAARQRMRCPEDWSQDTIASWRSLEERFLCDACEALVVAYAFTEGVS